MDDMRTLLNRINADSLSALSLLPPESIIVKAGESLQSALDIGGNISLEAGAKFQGTYIFKKPTNLIGNDATIVGNVDINVSDVTINNLFAEGNPLVKQIFMLGRNDTTQNTVEKVPARINLMGIKVSPFVGRRVFYVCAQDVIISKCSVEDCDDTVSGSDSQAILVVNTPGNILVTDCPKLTASSEIFLAGGDTRKIPVGPRNIRLINNRFFRPLTWMGGNRVIKTTVELKDAEDVIIDGNVLDGCWHDNQDGYAITLTPRNSGGVRNVQVTNNTIINHSSVFNIMGWDNTTPSPYATTGIIVQDNTFNVTKLGLGGRGIIALMTTGVGDVTFERNKQLFDGPSILITAEGTRMLPDGTTVKVDKFGKLGIRANNSMVGMYGLNLNGYMNGANWQNAVEALDVTNNTFTDANSLFKKNFPNNVYKALGEA